MAVFSSRVLQGDVLVVGVLVMLERKRANAREKGKQNSLFLIRIIV